MTDRNRRLHEAPLHDLTELKLTQIAEIYREVLDEAARNNMGHPKKAATSFRR